jgi:hypothetical protein
MAVAAGIAFTFGYFQETVMKDTTRADADADEDNAELAFERLSIEKSEDKALFYLNYAISHCINRFTDFQFIRHIVSKHRNVRVISHCTRVISWFPGELRALGVLCTEGSVRRDLSFSEKFILFQLSRIQLLRESSASSLAVNMLAAVTLASNDIIVKMRSFWERTECDLGYINQLSKDLAKAITQWQKPSTISPTASNFGRPTSLSCLGRHPVPERGGRKCPHGPP